jgi:hypothetical protein
VEKVHVHASKTKKLLYLFLLISEKNLFENVKNKIDFPDVVSRKVNLIKSNETLLKNCPDLKQVKDINGNTVLGVKPQIMYS